ncbi:class I fructose-bisphosphate aldolase family protein [Candidatus Micrarchaeota archaeon]|nr:class I fructose-bisphosphate aldolase family protein [Candidatus Micrarchaeota archaeon]
MVGKRIRMDRIFNRNTKRSIIIAMDHGMSMGPIKGLVNMEETMNKVVEGGANAVIVHKGIVRMGYRGYGEDIGLILHLSGSTSLNPDPNDKELVSTVEHAIKIGADGVSVHINVGAPNESKMIKQLGLVAEEADNWGMPLLAMMYPRGHEIKNPEKHVAHVVRVGVELGADIIKTPYTGNVETFMEAVDGAGNMPVVIAGGPKMDTTKDVLQMVYDSLHAGGAGVSLGRNVFQAKDPVKMVKALDALIHRKKSVEEALGIAGDQ